MLTLKGHKNRIERVRYSPSGKLLASDSADGSTRLWHMPTGQTSDELRPEKEEYSYGFLGFLDDARVALRYCKRECGYDEAIAQEIITYDVARKKTVKRLGSFVSTSSCDLIGPIEFAPDGKSWAIAQGVPPREPQPYPVRISILPHKKEVATLTGTRGNVRLVFASDGKTLAASVDQTVNLWDVPAYTERATLKQRIAVCDVTFSPDGETLAVAANRDVFLWDMSTLKIRASLPRQARVVQEIAYSPDGRLVATACNDATVRLFDAASGRERAIFDSQFSKLCTVAFSPGGGTIAAGGSSRHVVVWDVDL